MYEPHAHCVQFFKAIALKVVWFIPDSDKVVDFVAGLSFQLSCPVTWASKRKLRLKEVTSKKRMFR